VATNIGGLPEAVGDRETGLLVAAQHPRAFADALERLLGNPGLRERMGQTGIGRVQERFSKEGMTAATFVVYQRAVHS